MKKSTWFLIACASGAALILGALHVKEYLAEQRLSVARLKCAAEGGVKDASAKSKVRAGEIKPWEMDWNSANPREQRGHLILECNPLKLEMLTNEGLFGEQHTVQAEVLKAYRATVRTDTERRLEGLAWFMLILGCIPYSWYFFLRRLAEISAAVRGK